MRNEAFLLTPFTDLTVEQQRLVWRMRTHPEISRWMAYTGPIAWEDHIAFIEHQAGNDQNLNWLATDDLGAIGVASLHGLDLNERVAELGIYRNPFRAERGLGSRLLNALHDLAFGKLGLERIWLKVDRSNVAAIRLYEVSGYGRIAKNEDERFLYMDLCTRGAARRPQTT